MAGIGGNGGDAPEKTRRIKPRKAATAPRRGARPAEGAADTRRYQFEFAEKVISAIERVKDSTASPTAAEAVRRCIMLADTLMQGQKDGAEIVMRYPDDREQKVIVI